MAATAQLKPAAERPTGVQRGAAALALLALVGALAVTIAGAVESWTAILASTCGVLTLVITGWYAVARRGARRKVAAGAAVAGAALVVVGLVAADVSGARVATVTVLALVAVVAARIGLANTAELADAPARHEVPPARHPVLIVNLRSGDGKAARAGLLDACRARGIDTVVLEPGDDLRALTARAIASGADAIGMAGGDGSQALVASAAVQHDLPMFVVPAGTRNHFALDLGLDRDDVLGALDACGDAVEQRIDLATVNGRTFVNNASLGAYAEIVQSPEYRAAKRRTVTEMLPDLVGPAATALDLRFVDPDGTMQTTAHVILVSNDPYRLHRVVARRSRRKRLDLGVLGIVTARVATAREAGRLVSLLMSGRGRRFPGWLDWTSPHFRIDSARPVEIALDGEALRLDPPLLFESHPGVLRVRLPRAATTRPPVASVLDLLSHSTLAQLARIASGSSR